MASAAADGTALAASGDAQLPPAATSASTAAATAGAGSQEPEELPCALPPLGAIGESAFGAATGGAGEQVAMASAAADGTTLAASDDAQLSPTATSASAAAATAEAGSQKPGELP
eukprot:816788-Prymnesium_polylepis.1